MRIFWSILFIICICPIGVAQEHHLTINCITMIDQKLPEHIQGKCFFGEGFKDSITIVYNMGRLEFVDTDKKLYELLAQHSSYTTDLRLCFEVDRLIGKHKIEKRQYCHRFRLYDFINHFIHPDAPLVCNIITLNRKKDKYLFYVQGDGFVSAIKDRKGKKIHWKNFVFTGTYF
jgi:hypothetical protein